MSFQGRLAALEGKYFREEEVLATRKAVEKLIEEGKLPSDALKALDEAQSRSSGISSTSHDDSDTSMHNLPTTVNRGRQAQQGFAAVPAQLHADAATVLSGASVCCRQGVVYNHVPGILPGTSQAGAYRLMQCSACCSSCKCSACKEPRAAPCSCGCCSLAHWLHTSMALPITAAAHALSACCSAPAAGLLVHAGDAHQLWAGQVGTAALCSQRLAQ